MFFAAAFEGGAGEDGGKPFSEEPVDIIAGLDEGVAGLGVEGDALGLAGAAVDVLAGFVGEDGIGHAVDEEEGAGEVFDVGGAVALWGHGDDAADGGMEFAGFDDDGAAEAMTDEGELVGADAPEEGAAGEDIEDAFFEDVRLAIVEAKDGDAGGLEEGGKACVEAVGGAIEAAHGAADADDGGGAAFDGVEDAFDGAAGSFEADAEGTRLGFDGCGGDAENAEVEVFGFFGVVPHVAGHWGKYTLRGQGWISPFGGASFTIQPGLVGCAEYDSGRRGGSGAMEAAAMCGIAGMLVAGGGEVPREEVLAMARVLRHRGPDGEGSYFGPGIGLGHTRLAIIDLSHASDQPFADEAAGLVLVFNGEIYNYVELRRELEGLGHRFRSRGDTEVLLRAFAEWREGAFARLNGMFACAIWDERRRELVLARDRFGEKPLYVARNGRELLFASEMKAILAARPGLRQPNLKAVYRYIARGDLNQDAESFYAGIESLPAGHVLVLDAEGRGAARRYWRPRAAATPRRHEEAVEAFRALFFDAVRLRLRSDVPVGSSLSGGIDSSSIVCVIHAQREAAGLGEQHTFSARFRSAAHDEGRFIDLVAARCGARRHDTWVEPDRFEAEFAALQYHQEEPIASTSPFAQWMVMRLAREHGTTVLLDGQGADELLGGYTQALGMFLAHWLRTGRVDEVMRLLWSSWRRYGSLREPVLFGAYYVLPGPVRDRLAERYFGSGSILAREVHDRYAPAHAGTIAPFRDRLRNELVRWQLTTQLPEFLRYADRNSMAFGREVRLPFLDHRLAEFCFGLRPEWLLEGATTKAVLRRAMEGIVPDAVLKRRDKLAYAPPQRSWARGVLRGWIRRHLEAAARRRDVFDPMAVGKVLEGFEAGEDDVLAWRVASMEAWFGLMVDRAPGPPPGYEGPNAGNLRD